MKTTTIKYLAFFLLMVSYNCASVTKINKTTEFQEWTATLEKISSQPVIYLDKAVYPKEKDSRFIKVTVSVTNKTAQQKTFPVKFVSIKNDKILKAQVYYEIGYLFANGESVFKPNEMRTIDVFFEFPKDQEPTVFEMPGIGDFTFKLEY